MDNGRLLKLCALNVCHDIHLCLYFQHSRINSFHFLSSLRSKKARNVANKEASFHFVAPGHMSEETRDMHLSSKSYVTR